MAIRLSSRWRLALIFILSAFISAELGRRHGDAWEEYVRRGLYAVRGDSIPDFAADQTDSLGIPFTYYPTQNGITPGYQYNATIVCNYALSYFDSLQADPQAPARTRFMHCVRWLQGHLSRRRDYALYEFHWQQPWYDSVQAPFTSGMTSGLAMEVMLKAFSLTGDSSLLHDASLLLQGFAVSVAAGGFTFQESTGWWYEEIADAGGHTPRILDGHIFALMGLHYYDSVRHDSLAGRYFRLGEAALRHVLPAYDAGDGNMYYDKYGKPADKKYKKILTAQMQKMFSATGDSTYWRYYRRWRAPMERHYAVRAVEQRNRSGLLLLLLLWAAAAAGLWAFAAGIRRLSGWGSR